jgi:hypothetical protein
MQMHDARRQMQHVRQAVQHASGTSAKLKARHLASCRHKKQQSAAHLSACKHFAERYCRNHQTRAVQAMPLSSKTATGADSRVPLAVSITTEPTITQNKSCRQGTAVIHMKESHQEENNTATKAYTTVPHHTRRGASRTKLLAASKHMKG